MPTVVNRHHFRGRALPEPSVYVGRGTPLGNPFTVAEYGQAALELYRRHLWARIQAGDAGVLAALDAITEAHHLVCSCAPRPCHADVIVKAWAWRQAQRGDVPSTDVG